MSKQTHGAFIRAQSVAGFHIARISLWRHGVCFQSERLHGCDTHAEAIEAGKAWARDRASDLPIVEC